MRLLRTSAGILALVALAGCGGTGVGSPGGDGIVDGIGVALADYVVVDLATGAVEARREVPDLRTDPAYRDRKMVFRRVPGGATRLGSGGGRGWGQPDEPDTAATSPAVFLAVFETTRAQWRHLGGGDPAAAVAPAALAGGSDDRLPVVGVSLRMVRSVVAAGGPLRGKLALPSDALWERAARAGAGGTFAWGEARDEATVARWARVRQTADGDGPAVPGGREANAWGFFDLAGNVWEWTAAGDLRGGSWADGLPMARPANRIALDEDTPHALAGVRLVYTP